MPTPPCARVWPLLLCVYPVCSCHSAATSSAQKEVKLVKCDRKVEFFSALRGREKSLSAERKKAEKGHFFSGKVRSRVMVTFRHQKPAGSSFHEYTRQVPGRVSSLLAWIMRKCGTKLCHILQQVQVQVQGNNIIRDNRF